MSSVVTTVQGRFGPRVEPDGVSFRVWAPAQSEIALVLEGGGEHPMSRDAEGFFTVSVQGIGHGQRYWFRLPQGLRPDPASRFQPDGPLGASQVFDARRFKWTDSAWCGVPARHRHVLYEMHVGTFTSEGTWKAAQSRLERLVELGVTTLEVLPIAEFAGTFGWGYDGVDLFAPTRLYGDPDAVRSFVDAAHRLGLSVILDVVYNHFGPVGNYIADFSPTFQGSTGEWGDLINYDGPGSREVRAFMIENAAYWISEFHFDGMRLDATQAIRDCSPEHIVSEIARAARSAAAPREVLIVGESESQDTRLLRIGGSYADGLDAIWSEDWHHAAYVALTGRRQAYFTDYQGTASEFAAMARHGALYQGQWYSWQTNPRGGYALHLGAASFVTFLENHDQAANTGLGTRLYQTVDQGLWRAFTALLLLGPSIPMLFQGQEFGSTRPFSYFADHEPALAAAVQTGRLDFLSQFPGLGTEPMRSLLPNPADPQMFVRCKLDDAEWSAGGPHLRLHQDLLRLRREDAVLCSLGTPAIRIESSAPAPRILLLRYLADEGHRLLVVNFGADHLSPMNDPLFAPLPRQSWDVVWSSEEPRYGGGGVTPFVQAGRWLIGAHTATLLRSG